MNNIYSKSTIIKDTIPYILNPLLLADSERKIRASFKYGISYVSIIDFLKYIKVSPKSKNELPIQENSILIRPAGSYNRPHKFAPLKIFIELFKTNKHILDLKGRMEHYDIDMLIVQCQDSNSNISRKTKKIKVEEIEEVDSSNESEEEKEDISEKRKKKDFIRTFFEISTNFDSYSKEEKNTFYAFMLMLKEHDVDFDILSSFLYKNIK